MVEDCDEPGGWNPTHPEDRALLAPDFGENPQWTFGSISGFLRVGSPNSLRRYGF